MKKIALLSVLLLVFFALPLSAATPNIREGKWEIITTMTAEGMPFPMPPMKINHCYTKKDLKDTSKTRPASGKKDCQIKDLVEKGNSASWKMVCKDGSTGTGQATYSGNSYTTVMKMKDKKGGASTTSIKARRLGDCK